MRLGTSATWHFSDLALQRLGTSATWHSSDLALQRLGTHATWHFSDLALMRQELQRRVVLTPAREGRGRKLRTLRGQRAKLSTLEIPSDSLKVDWAEKSTQVR